MQRVRRLLPAAPPAILVEPTFFFIFAGIACREGCENSVEQMFVGHRGSRVENLVKPLNPPVFAQATHSERKIKMENVGIYPFQLEIINIGEKFFGSAASMAALFVFFGVNFLNEGIPRHSF
jgi:hypothetical protein